MVKGLFDSRMHLPCKELLSNGKNETTKYAMTNDLVGGHYILQQNTQMHGRLVLWTLPDLPLIWPKIYYGPSSNITLDIVHNFTMISVNSSDK
jgi:hypothetical protein